MSKKDLKQYIIDESSNNTENIYNVDSNTDPIVSKETNLITNANFPTKTVKIVLFEYYTPNDNNTIICAVLKAYPTISEYYEPEIDNFSYLIVKTPDNKIGIALPIATASNKPDNKIWFFLCSLLSHKLIFFDIIEDAEDWIIRDRARCQQLDINLDEDQKYYISDGTNFRTKAKTLKEALLIRKSDRLLHYTLSNITIASNVEQAKELFFTFGMINITLDYDFAKFPKGSDEFNSFKLKFPKVLWNRVEKCYMGKIHKNHLDALRKYGNVEIIDKKFTQRDKALNYAQKLLDRADKRDEWANKAQIESNQSWKQAHQMASVIPFGQPILVGHHSEKHDRKYRTKISNKQHQAHELGQKAQDHENKADNLRYMAESIINKGSTERKRKQHVQNLLKVLKIGSVVRTGHYGDCVITKINKTTVNMHKVTDPEASIKRYEIAYIFNILE